MDMGEWYAELDVKTSLFCLFHTERTGAYGSYSSLNEAREEADKRNKEGRKPGRDRS